MPKADPVFKKLGDEVGQGHPLRKPIYEKLERELGPDQRVVSFFTSGRFPVLIEDEDATMLEEVLATTDLDGKKLVLILNSPGGDAIAAERIVNVCRTYAPDGFRVIVPKAAKSAATMVSFGADEILLSGTSELGPIDPQILIRDDKGNPFRYQAAHEIIESYNVLMADAVNTKGRIEPYLQQLARFDARDIRNIQSAQLLSENIAVKLLRRGMMRGMTEAQIKSKIKLFTEPRKTKDHGRPVFHAEAKRCGLNVTLQDVNSKLWRLVWELHARLHSLTMTSAGKAIETVEESYIAGSGN